MLVLCLGMPRSASTWSFNVCRALLAEERPAYAGYLEHLEHLPARPGGTAVVKSHGADPVADRLIRARECLAIYTERNPADAVASSMTMFDLTFERAYARVRDSLSMWRAYRALPNALTIQYADILVNPAACVRRIAGHLGRLEDDDGYRVIANDLCLERMRDLSSRLLRDPSLLNADGYHQETLFHPGHVRNGSVGYAGRLLTPAQLDRCTALA